MSSCECCKKNPGELVYYHRDICRQCWEKHCDGKIKLKEVFEIGKEKQKKL